MIELPEISVFAGAIADHRFLAALAISALAGLVRGFSGFGSALIYMPLVASVYDPRLAAVTLLLIDTAGSAPFAVRALAQCTWREVLPIVLGAAVAIPFGTMALLVVDPIVLRWCIAAMVLSVVIHSLSIFLIFLCSRHNDSGLGLLGVYSVAPFGLLANALPISPGGLGVGEQSFELLYRLVGARNGASSFLTARFFIYSPALLGALVAATLFLRLHKMALFQGSRGK